MFRLVNTEERTDDGLTLNQNLILDPSTGILTEGGGGGMGDGSRHGLFLLFNCKLVRFHLDSDIRVSMLS